MFNARYFLESLMGKILHKLKALEFKKEAVYFSGVSECKCNWSKIEFDLLFSSLDRVNSIESSNKCNGIGHFFILCTSIIKYIVFNI